MKVTVLAENLKKSLGIVNRGISSRPQLPILSGILVKATGEGLILMSTDLEISFWVKVGAKVIEEGEIVMPAKLLLDLVISLPSGPMELVVEKQTLKIVCGSIKAEVVGQAADDFPSIPKSKKVQLVIKAEDYKEKVEKICVSAAHDDTRPVLTGVLWDIKGEGVTLAATDGYRLAVDQLPLVKSDEKKEEKLILPARSLSEVAKALSDTGESKLGMEFDKENQQVIFVLNEMEIASRLIGGEFPPYQQIMPNTYSTRLTFEKGDFMDAVKRASLFAKDNANVIKLEIGDSKVSVMAESSQIGSNVTEVEAEVEGEGMVVAFNAKYLLEYLNVCEAEQITWETEGELKPSVFKVDGLTWTQVIMPVRVLN